MPGSRSSVSPRTKSANGNSRSRSREPRFAGAPPGNRPGDEVTATGAEATGALPGAGGPTVMLGADSLRERMQRFLVAWSRFLGDRAAAVDYVDLRYGSGMAVRWREPRMQHEDADAAASATAGATGTT